MKTFLLADLFLDCVWYVIFTLFLQVYIVYLGANRLQNAALASSHHLHLLSKVFTRFLTFLKTHLVLSIIRAANFGYFVIAKKMRDDPCCTVTHTASQASLPNLTQHKLLLQQVILPPLYYGGKIIPTVKQFGLVLVILGQITILLFQ